MKQGNIIVYRRTYVGDIVEGMALSAKQARAITSEKVIIAKRDEKKTETQSSLPRERMHVVSRHGKWQHFATKGRGTNKSWKHHHGGRRNQQYHIS